MCSVYRSLFTCLNSFSPKGYASFSLCTKILTHKNAQFCSSLSFWLRPITYTSVNDKFSVSKEKNVHTVNLGFNILYVNSVLVNSQRCIRYRTHYQSQHQNDLKNNKTSSTNNTTESSFNSIKASEEKLTGESEVPQDEPPVKPSLYQRFKQTYKQHGKILIAVHLVTSSAWLSCFFLAVKSGVDIVPLLESWNLSEKIISPFRSEGGLGDLALAYLLYKLFTPARYAVTIGGTNLAIKYLRKEGKMKEIPQEDRLRSLYKEGKENLKKKSRNRKKRKLSLQKGSKQDQR